MSDLSGKYKVHIGGRDRGLRYTLEDREILEGMFPRGDGTPNDLLGLLRQHLVASGSIAVQAALLWAGLHRVDSRINLKKVKDWLQKEMEGNSVALKEIFVPVFNAVFESGCLGMVVKEAITKDDLESEEEESEEEDPKAGSSGTPSPT